MESVEKQIERKIKRKSQGTLWFPEDFSDLGSSEAVRKALDRLEGKEIIYRLAQGIYVRPKVSQYVGIVMPSAESVAQAIAKRDRMRTVPTGLYALNALGLSTQIPMKIVLLTDGSPRKIKLGKRTIEFKKTTPKNLLAKGKISRLVIQALKELGNNKVTEEEEKKIIDLLKGENIKDLMHDITLAPVWIQNLMKKAVYNGHD